MLWLMHDGPRKCLYVRFDGHVVALFSVVLSWVRATQCVGLMRYNNRARSRNRMFCLFREG